MKIILIGSGNLATQLGTALKNAGNTILQVYSRDISHASILAKKLNAESFTDSESEILKTADIYIVALTDKASESFIRRFDFGTKIIAHTSGTLPLQVLGKKIHSGVIYPLQTLSKTRKAKFREVPVCIEATDKKTEEILSELASSISGNVQHLDSEQRKVLHVAAVFVNNFSNYLYAAAEDILNKNDISFDLLKPLIRETAAKVMTHSPRDMQTGPALRKDKKVLEAHLRFLKAFPEYRKIYQLLSDNMVNGKTD